MSSTENDETTPNKNKKPVSLVSNLTHFLISLLVIIVVIVLYFISGGLILYACKIAQSNVLPTDAKCYPYTDAPPTVQPIETNLFTTFSDPPMSMKLSIPYDNDNSKNIVIDILRNYKYEPYSSSTANYFISLFEGLFSFNYSSMNFMFNIMNYLPESLILFIGPILTPILCTLVFLIDHVYVLYLWFANMGWFFKKNVNAESDHRPVWEEVTLLEPIEYAWSVGMVILFCILFWLLLSTLPFLPFLTMSWTLLSIIGYHGTMNTKKVTVGNIIQNVFKYYKVTFMSIFSFFVVSNTFSTLGMIPGIFSILTVICIFFGIFTMDVFKAPVEQGLSALVSNHQAKKKCLLPKVERKNNGLLYDLFFSQSGGKQFVKDMKHVGKILAHTK